MYRAKRRMMVSNMGCLSAYAYAQSFYGTPWHFIDYNGLKRAIPICIPISCASPFSAALAGFAPGSSSTWLSGTCKYPVPQPAAHLPQLLRRPLAELAPHQRFDSQLSSSKARAARRLLVARTPVFSRVTRVANSVATSIRSPPGRPAAQLAPIVIPAPARLGPPRFRELSGVPTVQDHRPWPGGSAPLPSSRLEC
ncbi:hypothetical protein TGAM01_v207441 [Trichoderma gamsii]|uniref:Uncharacterized protein n=1 Tax=Trichoderma gamsii TaxID=398673 RepID=A0A2P4ZHN3_9HYPO|nr:hypothetical protein TGAM01_v207441 [Trichoderma gamsii]PON23794.1 hypothetical protein TGAM01_v207441 [Trichoderma gamsii]